ncbi:hypothetical protein UVI_02018190 [Ustilaginoidea virens]|uniref:Fork-head domain-containing protein n=1 Tax=Ustilaginoidea virens TaxID=1159556 RepID=A0A1B5KS82_USTVR|nr:hypothetical protein UVI_02018190 [Ustilaginoidea virens]
MAFAGLSSKQPETWCLSPGSISVKTAKAKAAFMPSYSPQPRAHGTMAPGQAAAAGQEAWPLTPLGSGSDGLDLSYCLQDAPAALDDIKAGYFAPASPGGWCAPGPMLYPARPATAEMALWPADLFAGPEASGTSPVARSVASLTDSPPASAGGSTPGDAPSAAQPPPPDAQSAPCSASPPSDTNEAEAACGGERSDEPYAKLIYKAFMSRPDHSMTLQEIYQWFRENTSKAVTETGGWQNSIRHNLSMNAAFTKRDKASSTSPRSLSSGDDSKRVNEWVLEDWAIRNGVQSTTRYRKTNYARRGGPGRVAVSPWTVEHSAKRALSGRKGGCATRNSRQRKRTYCQVIPLEHTEHNAQHEHQQQQQQQQHQQQHEHEHQQHQHQHQQHQHQHQQHHDVLDSCGGGRQSCSPSAAELYEYAARHEGAIPPGISTRFDAAPCFASPLGAAGDYGLEASLGAGMPRPPHEREEHLLASGSHLHQQHQQRLLAQHHHHHHHVVACDEPPIGGPYARLPSAHVPAGAAAGFADPQRPGACRAFPDANACAASPPAPTSPPRPPFHHHHQDLLDPYVWWSHHSQCL